MPRPRTRVLRLIAAATTVAGVLLLPSSPSAQSGGQYLRFQQWCRSIGGTLSGGDNRPNCIPPARSFGGGGGGAVVVPQGPSPEQIREQLRREQARAKHDAAGKFWRNGNWDEVIRLYEEALALVPGDPVYTDNLNRARSARDARRKWDSFLSAFHAGRAAYGAGRYADAVRHYEQATAIDPADKAAANNLRLAREQLARVVREANQAAAVPGAVSDSNRRLQELLGQPTVGSNVSAGGIEAVASIQRLGEILNLADVPAWQWRSRVEAVVTILATPWVVGLPYVADTMQREVVIKQAREELKNLLEQTLNDAMARMLTDVRRIEPFPWNPYGAEQRAVIAQTERELAAARADAAREIRSDQTYQNISNGQDAAIEYRSGPAMRQLRDLHRTTIWFDQ